MVMRGVVVRSSHRARAPRAKMACTALSWSVHGLTSRTAGSVGTGTLQTLDLHDLGQWSRVAAMHLCQTHSSQFRKLVLRASRRAQTQRVTVCACVRVCVCGGGGVWCVCVCWGGGGGRQITYGSGKKSHMNASLHFEYVY